VNITEGDGQKKSTAGKSDVNREVYTLADTVWDPTIKRIDDSKESFDILGPARFV